MRDGDRARRGSHIPEDLARCWGDAAYVSRPSSWTRARRSYPFLSEHHPDRVCVLVLLAFLVRVSLRRRGIRSSHHDEAFSPFLTYSEVFERCFAHLGVGSALRLSDDSHPECIALLLGSSSGCGGRGCVSSGCWLSSGSSRFYG